MNVNPLTTYLLHALSPLYGLNYGLVLRLLALETEVALLEILESLES